MLKIWQKGTMTYRAPVGAIIPSSQVAQLTVVGEPDYSHPHCLGILSWFYLLL